MTMTDTRTATVGKRLRTARLFAGMEQSDLAKELGVARQTVSNWENDRNELPARVMIKWAELTRVTLNWIAYGRNRIAPSEDGAEGVRPEGFEPPAY